MWNSLQTYNIVFRSTADVKFLFQRYKIYELIIFQKLEEAVSYYNLVFKNIIDKPEYHYLIRHFPLIFFNFGQSQKIIYDNYVLLKEALLSKVQSLYYDTVKRKEIMIVRKKGGKLIELEKSLLYKELQQDEISIKLLEVEKKVIVKLEKHLIEFKNKASSVFLYEEVFNQLQSNSEDPRIFKGFESKEIEDSNIVSKYENNYYKLNNLSKSSTLSLSTTTESRLNSFKIYNSNNNLLLNSNISLDSETIEVKTEYNSSNRKNNSNYFNSNNISKKYYTIEEDSLITDNDINKNKYLSSIIKQIKINNSNKLINNDFDINFNNDNKDIKDVKSSSNSLVYGVSEKNIPKVNDDQTFIIIIGTNAKDFFSLCFKSNLNTKQILTDFYLNVINKKSSANCKESLVKISFTSEVIKKENLNKIIIRHFRKYIISCYFYSESNINYIRSVLDSYNAINNEDSNNNNYYNMDNNKDNMDNYNIIKKETHNIYDISNINKDISKNIISTSSNNSNIANISNNQYNNDKEDNYYDNSGCNVLRNNKTKDT